MPEKTFVVHDRIPLPARRLGAVVQQVLKVGKSLAVEVIQGGCVRVNGHTAWKAHQPLEVGDRLEIDYEPVDRQPPPVAQDTFQKLEILFEDEHLVVVEKPPALLTVPTSYQEPNTLISQLEKRLQKANRKQRAFCVHRLDRGVSGVLVFAKRLEVAQQLRDQFEARKPSRRYIAVVAGAMKKREGTFRSYLLTDDELNRYSTDDEENGELAITHYRVLATTPDATVVEVHLETGRRNQIRVHFAEAGHPVLGDRRYGQKTGPTKQWPYRRLALHAETLGFQHPLSGESLEFRSPVPREMRAFMATPDRAHPRRPS